MSVRPARQFVSARRTAPDTTRQRRVSAQRVLLAILALVSLAACNNQAPAPQGGAPQPAGGPPKTAGGPPGAGAPGQMPTPEVNVVQVAAQTVPLTRELVGRLASSRVAEVRARVAGIILKQVYTEGTDVKAGQVLFQIDPAPLRAALHAQEAALARAQADADNAGDIARRYTDLHAKNLISRQDIDNALATQRTTAAVVKQAEANLETAQLNLGYATVTAPIAGRAGRAQVTEGALVGQGEATVLTRIEQIDPIYVNFSQTLAEFEQLRDSAGREARAGGAKKIAVDVLLQGGVYPEKGSLDFADLAVDPGTGAVSLRAVIPNPDKTLLPGMFVNLRLTTGKLDGAYTVPQAAVQRDPRGAYVLIVDDTGTVQQRRIELAAMLADTWAVSGELKDGDQVIVAGLQKVKPGAPARIAQPGQRPAGGPPGAAAGGPASGAPGGQAGGKPPQ